MLELDDPEFTDGERHSRKRKVEKGVEKGGVEKRVIVSLRSVLS